MFVTRLLSGIVLVLIALLTIITGGPILFLTMLIVSLIGMNELFKVTKVEEEGKTSPLAIVGYAGAVLYYLAVLYGREELILPALTVAMIGLLFVYVFTYPRYLSGQVMSAFFAIIYVAVMLSFVYRTRLLPNGQYSVWLIFLCSWGCDTLAYCSGMLFGKHKMAPVLSPKKSVEGAVGGVIGAALLGLIYALVMTHYVTELPALEYALICAVGALISMVGDLAASAIKRNHKIKDYGHLIPGHGGILDRFDSVIITAPIIYVLALLLT